MSDYMFMLDSHLSGPQARAMQLIVSTAQELGLNLFLYGGAIRDMLGGFPIRDLDFVIEGPTTKLAKALEKKGAKPTGGDEVRKTHEFEIDGSPASITMSASERFAKTGSKPQITEAPIHDHLRSRDFTFNAIALSLNKGSRGLLIDPTNGASDIANREIRAISNYCFYDDPARLLRLHRLRVRMGLTVDPRTQTQFENAVEAGVASLIAPPALRLELTRAAAEPNAGELVETWESAGLLTLFSPALTGAKTNQAGFQRLQKVQQSIPFGAEMRLDPLGLFLVILTEQLSPKERAALAKNAALTKADLKLWQDLEPRAKKLEKALQSAKLSKASQVYAMLSKCPGDEVLLLSIRTQHRLVGDRLKNYFQKYLPTALEVTDQDVIDRGGVPGSPKWAAKREEVIGLRLDGRIRKPAPPPPPPPPPPAPRRFN